MTEQFDKKNRKRNLQIEGLRGISILIILIYHLIDQYQQIYLETSVPWMDMWGTLGTTAFLMISAYFLIDLKNNEISLSRAISIFLKKILRLWPCYAICITITFMVSYILSLPGRTVTFVDYILNLFMVNRFLGAPYVDGAHWYLSVLLSVSIIILIFRILKIQHICGTYIIWLLVELLIDKFSPFRNMYILGGPFVGVICTGIALKNVMALISSDYDDYKNKAVIKWFGVFLISVFCTYVSRGWICAIELLAITVVFGLCVLQRIPILAKPFFVFIGMISYPLYLIHQNIGFMIEIKLSELIGLWNYSIGFVAVFVTIILGIVLFYLVEQPIQNKLSKTLLKKL